MTGEVASERTFVERGRDPSVHALVRAAANRLPEAPAIAMSGRDPLPYALLLARLEDVARFLHGMGIRRRHRVALALPHGPEQAVAALAISGVATCVPLSPTYRAHEYESYLGSLKVDALVLQPDIQSPARWVADAHGIPIIDLVPLASAAAGTFRLTASDRHTNSGAIRPHSGGSPSGAGVAFVMHTSGTTSRPKIVPLMHSSLSASARNILGTLSLTEGDRCLAMMPLFHIHGLMVTLASLSAGSAVLFPSSPGASGFFRALEQLHPTWYSAVPTIHHAILTHAPQHLDVIRRRPVRLIRSSSSTLPRRVSTELERVFRAPVIESYGMTEACHQIASNPLPPQERRPGSVGLPAGPEVAVADERGRHLAPGEMGEILLRGDTVIRAYEDNTDVNATSFLDGWLRTGDQGFIGPDGYLFLTGRLRDIINRGGQKIAPAEVDEVLMSHPAVSQAVAFARPHPTLGKEVAAAIVLRQNTPATEIEIRRFAATRLSDYKVPRRIFFLDAMPSGDSGKIRRTGLVDRLLAADTSRRAAPHQVTPPRDALETQLVELWEELLPVRPIGVTDDFFEVGGHSLLAMRLCDQIEKTLGKRLPPAALYQAPTIEQLAAILGQERWSLPLSSLVALQPHGSRPPFFWVHGENSNAFLARDLGPDQPLYGLLQQGRDGKRALYTRLEDIAAHYLREVRGVQPSGPYFLGGYCVGGLLAFEMAQQLRRQSEEVALLVLLDPPTPRPGESSRSLGSHDSRVMPDSPRVGDRVSRHWRHLARLGGQEKLAYLRDGVSRKVRGQLTKFTDLAKKVAGTVYLLTGTESRLPPSLRVPYINAVHHRALRGHVPRVYPDRVVMFRTQGSPRDPRLVWERLAAGGLEISEIPGKHTEIVFKKPQIQVLAKQLKACLDRAHGPGR